MDSPGLVIPHPLIPLRGFVLVLMDAICPGAGPPGPPQDRPAAAAGVPRSFRRYLSTRRDKKRAAPEGSSSFS
ncbi:MAG: 2-amino-4-hydroxy-6-hydroxymethyldihydropteridine diphosphokinase [Marinilabiliales bacterium]|nr:2-amino-4-hydroxy-6-hydroxymethyldihydropteridine diphosphokinase [Marinilabiliales bacterium]